MKDQVRAMREIGVAGEATNELQTSIFHGHYQLVFLSPESLVNNFR